MEDDTWDDVAWGALPGWGPSFAPGHVEDDIEWLDSLPSHMRPFAAAFDRASYNNVWWMFAVWHAVLGVILRKQRTRVGGVEIDARVPVLLIGRSGTGKTRGVNLGTGLLQEAHHFAGPMGLGDPYQVSHVTSVTDASLVGWVNWRRATKRDVEAGDARTPGDPIAAVEPGALSWLHLLHVDEAGFVWNRSENAPNLRAILNQTFDADNSIGKLLRGMSPLVKDQLAFRSETSLIAEVTDALAPRFAHLLEGFFQRLLISARPPPTKEEARVNRQREVWINRAEPRRRRAWDEEREGVVLFLEETSKRYSQPVEWDFSQVEDNILAEVAKVESELAFPSPSFQAVVGGFTARLSDRIRRLALHHCAARTLKEPLDNLHPRRVVDFDDVQLASLVAVECLRSFLKYAYAAVPDPEAGARRAIRSRAADDRRSPPA